MQITELVRLYHGVLNTLNTQVAKKYEKQLLALQSHPQFEKQNLMVILSPQISYNIRKLAAIQMERYAQRLVERQNILKIAILIRVLIQEINSQQLQFNLKLFLMKTITILFSAQQTQNIKQQFIQNFDQMMKSIQQTQALNLEYYAFCFQLIISFQQFIPKVNKLIKIHFGRFANLALQIHLRMIQTSPNIQQNLISTYKTAAIYGRLLRAMLKRVKYQEQTTKEMLFSNALAQTVSIALKVNHPKNTPVNSFLIMADEKQELATAFNEYKIVYFEYLQLFLRVSNGLLKDKFQLLKSPLINQAFDIFERAIFILQSQFQTQPLFTQLVKSRSLQSACYLMKLLQCGLTISSVFHDIFNNHKETMIEKVILKCLLLSSQEAQLFQQSPEEFAERALQVTAISSVFQQFSAYQQQEMPHFDMLKCIAASCLVTLCKMQDGAVTHLYDYAFDCLQRKNTSNYPFYVFYQAMAILKNTLKSRTDIKNRLINYIDYQISQMIAIKSPSTQIKINFFYFLILIAKVVDVQELSKDLSDKIIELTQMALASECQSWQYVAHQLLKESDDKGYARAKLYQIFNLYHLIFMKRKPTCKSLMTYNSLLNENLCFSAQNKDLLIASIHIIRDYIVQEVKSLQPNKYFMQLCFNIIHDIGQNYYNIDGMIDQLENAILPCAQYCKNKTQLDFQDELFIILTSFVHKRKSITHIEWQIINIIPIIYYNQYREVFGQTFSTLQVFILYGSDIIQNSLQTRNAIVQMGIQSLKHPKSVRHSQLDACAGVLILQSYLAAFGERLPEEQLKTIFDQSIRRLQINIKDNFLSANLKALLSLILAQLINSFDYSQGFKALHFLVSHLQVFNKVEYAPKLMIVGLSSLLLFVDNQLVKQTFGSIFTAIIKVLWYQLQVIDRILDEEWQQEYDQYSQLLKKVVNNVKEIDDLLFFQKRFQIFKSANRVLVEKAIKQLQLEDHKKFIEIMRSQRVQNSLRVIYKAK